MTPNQTTVLSSQIDPKLINSSEVRAALTSVANSFVKTQGKHTEIWAASQDWFLEPWGRDTFISLPGLLLSTGRFEEAKNVFRTFAVQEKNGLIPNRIQAHQTLYNTVDASLWFIVALQKYLAVTGDKKFVKEIWPTVQNIIKGYQHGTSFRHFDRDHFIRADEDGLIIAPAQATWMDADPSGTGTQIVTPRNGKAVEINALWYASLIFVAEFDQQPELQKLAVQVKKSFNRRFWNKAELCLLDVVDGDPHSGALRPNQIIAISHGQDLLSKTKQRQVLAAVTRDLLTPGGLRTLSPRDSNYQGQYDTSAPMSIKDWAYHQGTVWPWLIGPYIDALAVVRHQQGKYPGAIKSEIYQALAPLMQFALDSPHQSLPEVFAGDIPHQPGGTTSQAWSVAEVLRVITQYDL